jgi:hypothetical protein
MVNRDRARKAGGVVDAPQRVHADGMKRQVVVLGAGFGGLELSTLLSERLADEVESR